MRVSVIGCGRWGSFLAWYLNRAGHQVILWGREGSRKLEAFKKTRSNGLVVLDDKVLLSNKLNEAADFAEVIVISINSQSLRSLMKDLSEFNLDGKTIVLCMKGIEENTGCRLSQVVEEYINGRCSIAIWVGPGHVQDFINNIPNCMVIDSHSRQTKEMLVEQFSTELIRFYYGNDIIGNEIGSAAKNVIGIAAGMLDGFGIPSLKGALMSRGTREVARLIKACGGNEMSAYGLCHLGDYEATVFSKYSHNRMFGEAFIKKQSYNELAEGVYTARALGVLCERYNVEMPIRDAVNDILDGRKEPEKALSNLFLRSIKYEF